MTSTIIVLVVLSACATSPWAPSSGDKPLLGTPPPEQGGDIPLAAATGGGIKGDENHSPQLEELAVRMGTLGAELGSEEQGASGESREISEDIPLEPELPEDLLEPPELPEMQLDVDEPGTGLGTLEDA